MTNGSVRATTFTLAASIAVVAWYFDYSDRFVHGAFAFVVAACSLAVPRAAAAAAALWLVLVALGHVLSPLPPPVIAEGTEVTEVLGSQGAPAFSGSVESLYAKRDWGYALPNPHRVNKATDVLVYYQPGGVMYLFISKGRVVMAKSGDS